MSKSIWSAETGWTDNGPDVTVHHDGFGRIVTMSNAERFFFDNAGLAFNPETETEKEGRIRGARRLAMAEARMIAGPYFADHEPDWEPWDGDVPYDGPLWVVTLYGVTDSDRPEILGSLGSVACEATDPYMRVVIAELADEYLPDAG